MIMQTNYNTKQRRIIEESLKEHSEKHLTADDIVYILKERGEKVGKATVYRTLEKLESENKVRKYVAERSESACWQYLENGNVCAEHFHLKCVKCGGLIHLDCSHISELCSHITAEHGFKVDLSKTVLYGICQKCGENL